MSTALILLAAGSGTRVGAATNKVLLPLGDSTVLGRSISTALEVPDVHRLLIVVRDGEQGPVSDAVAPLLGPGEVRLVVGGSSRHASERAALLALRDEIDAGEIDVVAIHDSARPLASASLFSETITAAREYGGAVPSVPLTHLVSRDLTPASDARLVGVQTPQAFRAAELLNAYRQAAEDGFDGTDTAACLERYSPSTRIAAVPSSSRNLKVTFPEDLATAAWLLP